jgi:hypothetical protein
MNRSWQRFEHDQHAISVVGTTRSGSRFAKIVSELRRIVCSP